MAVQRRARSGLIGSPWSLHQEQRLAKILKEHYLMSRYTLFLKEVKRQKSASWLARPHCFLDE